MCNLPDLDSWEDISLDEFREDCDEIQERMAAVVEFVKKEDYNYSPLDLLLYKINNIRDHFTIVDIRMLYSDVYDKTQTLYILLRFSAMWFPHDPEISTELYNITNLTTRLAHKLWQHLEIRRCKRVKKAKEDKK